MSIIRVDPELDGYAVFVDITDERSVDYYYADTAQAVLKAAKIDEQGSFTRCRIFVDFPIALPFQFQLRQIKLHVYTNSSGYDPRTTHIRKMAHKASYYAGNYMALYAALTGSAYNSDLDLTAETWHEIVLGGTAVADLQSHPTWFSLAITLTNEVLENDCIFRSTRYPGTFAPYIELIGRRHQTGG
jgi:hypothetical protein